MNAVKNIVGRFNRRLFDSVISNKLIYNSCWEDPRIDRTLLELDDSSEVVMLTSAGDNALDYLLDGPARIHCVDINPAQNALLELKQSLFRHGKQELLWALFGRGSYAETTPLYHDHLRPMLSPSAQHFWDHHLDYFSPFTGSGSFYYRGTSGTFAMILCNLLKRKGLYKSINNLLESTSLAEQRYYFQEIEPHLWNSFSRWIIKQDAAMTLIGVPETQRRMIETDFSGGLAGFIHQAVKAVFTERPVQDNYCWRAYLTGSYTPACCPNYLKEKKFSQIKQLIGRVYINTNSFINFLAHHPGSYSHFVLLDHQDWLPEHHPEKLKKQWKLILKNARPGAKVLFRSAGKSRSFLPDFVHRYVHFEDEKTQHLHDRDRVGTYGSTHLAIIDKTL